MSPEFPYQKSILTLSAAAGPARIDPTTKAPTAKRSLAFITPSLKDANGRCDSSPIVESNIIEAGRLAQCYIGQNSLRIAAVLLQNWRRTIVPARRLRRPTSGHDAD